MIVFVPGLLVTVSSHQLISRYSATFTEVKQEVHVHLFLPPCPFVHREVLKSIFPPLFFHHSLLIMLLCTGSSHENRREATQKEEPFFLSNQNYICLWFPGRCGVMWHWCCNILHVITSSKHTQFLIVCYAEVSLLKIFYD